MGMGWNVVALIWNGHEGIGWLNADNLLEQKALTNQDVEILRLFALALGPLCTRKRAEDALRALNQELEGRVRERTSDLEAAVSGLRESGILGWMTSTQSGQIRFILVGIALMIIVIFRPQGIFGNKKELAFA